MEAVLGSITGLILCVCLVYASGELADKVAGIKIVRINDPDLKSKMFKSIGQRIPGLRHRVHEDVVSLPRRIIVSGIVFAVSLLLSAVLAYFAFLSVAESSANSSIFRSMAIMMGVMGVIQFVPLSGFRSKTVYQAISQPDLTRAQGALRIIFFKLQLERRPQDWPASVVDFLNPHLLEEQQKVIAMSQLYSVYRDTGKFDVMDSLARDFVSNADDVPEAYAKSVALYIGAWNALERRLDLEEGKRLQARAKLCSSRRDGLELTVETYVALLEEDIETAKNTAKELYGVICSNVHPRLADYYIEELSGLHPEIKRMFENGEVPVPEKLGQPI